MHNDRSRGRKLDVCDATLMGLDRAIAVLHAAREAGLVNRDDSFAPALRATLDRFGVRSLAKLTPGQACTVVDSFRPSYGLV